MSRHLKSKRTTTYGLVEIREASNGWYELHVNGQLKEQSKDLNYIEGRYDFYSDVGGIGGCYLTTACVSALRDDFRDDCAELTTLRMFRDTYVRENHPENITKYYATAPHIVAAIDGRDDAQAIYTKMYQDLVLATINLIEQGNLEQAFVLYKSYGDELQAQYC
ncbi:MAG: hypothetical protein Q4A82_01755 [Corynebacterium sp.]|nr:hypothetical protein [Corynebacterium sp.]